MKEPLDIVIVGGGTAGWMCAAAIASVAGPRIARVTLVESDDIGSVGVGEATLPQMKEFNDRLGINEADMMSQTNATFKLGIQFVDWGKIGNRYIHPFGKFGKPIGGAHFHQHWARLNNSAQHSVETIGAYSYAIECCQQNRFEFPVPDHNYINSTYSYAYHFDAALYAAYLRRFAEGKGVHRVQGKIVRVSNHADTGAIETVTLENGATIKGDFFIDCSGFRSLLLGQHLKAEFDDWSPWLVCNKAFAVPSEKSAPLTPYTQSIARSAGWQWRIPLQHRTGNGYVFCDRYISEDEAAHSLLQNLDGKPLGTPKLIQFKAGRYKKSWQKNCLAIGLSSGFLEPLESTSIYLIQVAIINFLKLFPHKHSNNALMDEYNRLIDYEYERVRDFLILHYHLNQRDDAELWRYCREMTVPESLTQKMLAFQKRGFLESDRPGLFAQPSWISVFNGQGLQQQGYDPFALNTTLAEANTQLDNLRQEIQNRAGQVPTHDEFIADYCAAIQQ